NFIAQVIFTNPYGSDEGKWDYGFLFRQTTDDNQYRLMTFSDGSWKLMNNINTPDGNLINEGVTSFMSTGASDSNFMRVVAYEERGWFFINDQLVGQVDLAARQAAGKVNLGTGFYTGNEKTGYETGYDDFSVWEIDAEGVSGELPHDDDSAIEEFEADVDLDNFIATGVFVNPYDFSFHTFDVGFLFRYTSGEQQYRMIISGNGKWGLMQNDGSADGTWIANDTAGNFNSGAGQRNRITLVALYDIGWLYINDNLTAELDLSGRRQSGDISIATGIYTNDEVVGYATAFEDFTVIPLP
ncbi:MAG: hypothetical protein HPY76_03900, partial [Anaerolineae bacterium]|nr:hypothetical protein [Anaerolineae bacterium]